MSDSIDRSKLIDEGWIDGSELRFKDFVDGLHQMRGMLDQPVADLSTRPITTTLNEKGQVIAIDEAPFTYDPVTREKTITLCDQEGKSFEAVVHFADSLSRHPDVLGVKLGSTTAITEVGEDIIDLFEQVAEPVSNNKRREVKDVILNEIKNMVKEDQMDEIKEVESKVDLPVAITGAGVGGYDRSRLNVIGSSTPILTSALIQGLAAMGGDFDSNSSFGFRNPRDGFRRYVPSGASAKVKAKRRKAIKKKHKR